VTGTKPVSSRQLTMSTDLGPDAAKAVADAINPLVADAFALYVKTKNFHWHIWGRHFRDYHLLLDEQGEQIFAMTDVLAERVRKLGGSTIRSIGHIARLQTVRDDDSDLVQPLEMLQRLLEDNRGFVARQRAAHGICDRFNDVATASLLENFIDETERRIWFLFEIISERASA
jgi:starvation-inducible DNA-binding protein